MKLLYKELMLAAHPTSLVFACLGCLVVVPAYPYTVIFHVWMPGSLYYVSLCQGNK